MRGGYNLQRRNGRPLFTLGDGGGTPIAFIRGGNYDGEILCIDKTAQINDGGVLGLDIGFKASDLEPLLDVRDRSCHYIAGPSGSGKTTMVTNLVEKHMEMNPGAQAYLFSRTRGDQDPAWHGLEEHVTQVILDDEFAKNPFDCTSLQPNTIIVFDDCATILDDKIRDTVEKCVMDALEVGRKSRIWVVVTSHNVVPHGKRSFQKSVINEATDFTVFPGFSAAPEIAKVLKDCLGMGAPAIRRIREAESRWVTIHNRAPKYVLEEHNAYMW